MALRLPATGLGRQGLVRSVPSPQETTHAVPAQGIQLTPEQKKQLEELVGALGYVDG